MDAQTVEVIGRNFLVSQLVRDGLEVARPERDHGVDLIAYLDLDESGDRFKAFPIRMKSATNTSFGLFRKYERFPHLLLAYVWHIHEPEAACSCGLTYSEALEVADAMGWTKTKSWEREGYSTTRPSLRLTDLLEPFRMRPGDWRRKILHLTVPLA
jgi:hypothetical protein